MWKAKSKDGKEISELNAKWSDIKDNISELLLITNTNQIIYLPKNLEYIQHKTASAEFGNNNSVQVESRTVGFRLGNNIVKIIVNEKNNNINVEVE